jgi:hypothetical protein
MPQLRSGLERRIRTARAIAGWWLGPNRASRRRLVALRDRHRGERCFVLGNAPSLNLVDLRRLKDETTFGLNRIYLKFDEIGFATDFLVCINKYVLRQFGDDLRQLGCLRFLAAGSSERFEPSDRLIVMPTRHAVGFARDPTWWGVHEGGTVTFVALQLAYLMGFAEVVLIGVDHRFRASGPPNLLVTATGNDQDHFDPRYYGPGVQWQLPDLVAAERSYELARHAFEAGGRRIVDATVDGDLQVFPKADLDRLLRG